MHPVLFEQVEEHATALVFRYVRVGFDLSAQAIDDTAIDSFEKFCWIDHAVDLTKGASRCLIQPVGVLEPGVTGDLRLEAGLGEIRPCEYDAIHAAGLGEVGFHG